MATMVSGFLHEELRLGRGLGNGPRPDAREIVTTTCRPRDLKRVPHREPDMESEVLREHPSEQTHDIILHKPSGEAGAYMNDKGPASMPAPIVTATVQSTCIAAASNVAAQALDHWHKNEPLSFSWMDFLRFTILNIMVAPPNFIWQGWLEKAFPARLGTAASSRSDQEAIEMEEAQGFLEKRSKDEAGNGEGRFSWVNTFKKWFLDCMTMGAIMNTTAFLILMGLMKGKSLGDIGLAIRKETIPIIVAGYKIWPIASVINFTFVPVEKRIVFLSFVGFLWGIYMSLVAARQ